jgi:hypothetical protein
MFHDVLDYIEFRTVAGGSSDPVTLLKELNNDMRANYFRSQ